MNLKEAVEQSKTQLKPFKRPSWHYCLWFEDMLGYYTDGYNCMDCSGISIDEAIAEDYELVTIIQNNDNTKEMER